MILNEPEDNYKTGYISIYRSIRNHWIWNDPIKFKWWIDILLTVNYMDKIINIGYDLYECNRGQSIQSLKTWGDKWNVSKDTVRNFFRLLSKDNMIKLENLKKTTRITVCNYDSYQVVLHDKQTTSKRQANDKQTQAHPNNKDNKDNKDNKEELFLRFWDKYHLITKLPKTDKDSTMKYWNKLKYLEKGKAIDNIQLYYDSLKEKKYCKKARTYLSDKNFNDEFNPVLNELTTSKPKPFGGYK